MLCAVAVSNSIAEKRRVIRKTRGVNVLLMRFVNDV
jgi:hypothetical protein